MKKLSVLFSVLILLITATNCKKELPKVEPIIDPADTLVTMADLVIPDDFHFETSRQVEVSFVDFKATKSNEIKYNVYLYTDETTSEEITYEDEEGEMVTETIEVSDVHNNLVTTVVSNDDNFILNLTIPEYYNFLYILRNEMGVYTSQIIPIDNNKAAYGGNMKSVADDPVDVIYGVNSSGDVFTLNPVSGDFVVIDHFPSNQAGSVTCALDPISRVMYTISRSTRDLLAYDIDNGTWEVRGYTGLSGPRLEYRKEDGLLYFSTGNKVMTLDVSNGSTISTYTVSGLHDDSWGDVAFDANGIFFMATKSGLYRCDPGGNNTYNAVRISADNLPYNLTSMTFDSNGELWIGSNDGGGQVVVMDQVTGGWEWRYRNLPVNINDLTFLPLDENDVEETDTDGDGIIDFYDEYPDDGDRAYDTYTPSIYGWGSYAFEDLWPNEGDYDFNDLVVNYRYINVANSNDQIVETKLLYSVKNVGGSFHNGFGLELDMPEALISSVSGYNHTAGIISLNGKGLENNQAKPVIIPFDDAWDNFDGEEMEVIITYTNPISLDEFGEMNPFIFINGDRGREVHFSDNMPTSLADPAFFGTADDDSDVANNRFYKTTNNLPWGINIIHDFVFLQEKSAIILGYNKFADWAESGGVDYTDWYKDQDGYRNNAYLVN